MAPPGAFPRVVRSCCCRRVVRCRKVVVVVDEVKPVKTIDEPEHAQAVNLAELSIRAMPDAQDSYDVINDGGISTAVLGLALLAYQHGIGRKAVQ